MKYLISCYSSDALIFSVSISMNNREINNLLNRGRLPINRKPLSREEFDTLSKRIVTKAEIVWTSSLSYHLECGN